MYYYCNQYILENEIIQDTSNMDITCDSTNNGISCTASCRPFYSMRGLYSSYGSFKCKKLWKMVYWSFEAGQEDTDFDFKCVMDKCPSPASIPETAWSLDWAKNTTRKKVGNLEIKTKNIFNNDL